MSEARSLEGYPLFVYGYARRRCGDKTGRGRGAEFKAHQEAGPYFLTLHLADALPKAEQRKLAERYRILQSAKQAGGQLLPEQQRLLAEISQRRIEEELDRGAGACPLSDARLAGAVAAALRYRDWKHYRLLAWCIMPNHVHVVLRPFPGHDLARVVRSWMLATAKPANFVLGQKGRFWRWEYYERAIGDKAELDRALGYVAGNPARAGLQNWLWTWSEGREAGDAAAQAT